MKFEVRSHSKESKFEGLDKQGQPTTVSSWALKTLFRLSRVLLDPKKCIISGGIKYVSVQ